MANTNLKNETSPRWDNFKQQVLEWKQAHADEYFDFAEKMDNGSIKGFIAMVQFMNTQLPELMEAWESGWRDDDINHADNMEELDKIVLKSDILKAWIGEIEVEDAAQTEHIGSLTLCWIIYGQVFETVIRHYERLKSSKHMGFIQKHVFLPSLIKKAINASIKGGYRTKRDWDRYFKLAKAYNKDLTVAEAVWEEMQEEISDERELAVLEEANLAMRKAIDGTDKLKENVAALKARLDIEMVQGNKPGRKKTEAQPLAEYLTCENKDGVLETLRQHIERNNSSVAIALTYVALHELGIISGVGNNRGYYRALRLQFSNIKGMKSESSCLHDLGEVQKFQKIYKDGKQCDGRLYEDDKYAPMYKALLRDLKGDEA